MTTTNTEQDYAWNCVTANAPFAPRDGAGALVFRGAMWLLGGWNPNDPVSFPRICNNEVLRTTNGREWSLEKPNTFRSLAFDPNSDWSGRHCAGYAVFKDRMWIVGGDANQGYCQRDVWASDDGRVWERVQKSVPWAPRALHHTVVFRDRLWVLFGQTLPSFCDDPEAFHNDVWSSADGVHWDQVPVAGRVTPYRGMIGGSAVLHGRIWILGGGTYDTPQTPDRKFYNDVWSSADGINWERHLEHAPWAPRQYHDVAVFDGKLWVMEGYSPGCGNRNDVWYSDDGMNWTELPGTPWAPRHAASVFVHDDALWMVAGNNMRSDVWKLTRVRQRSARRQSP